jgi:hypothetical protein
MLQNSVCALSEIQFEDAQQVSTAVIPNCVTAAPKGFEKRCQECLKILNIPNFYSCFTNKLPQIVIFSRQRLPPNFYKSHRVLRTKKA